MSGNEDRVKELKSILAAKQDEAKAIGDAFEIKDGTVVVTSEQKSAFQAVMADVREVKGLLDDFNALSAGPADRTPISESVAQVVDAIGGSAGIKSLGEMFMDSPEFKSLNNGKNGYNMTSSFEVSRGNIGSMWNQKDIYSSLPGGTPTAFGRIERDPMVLPPQRTRRVRDLFPQRTTTAAIIEYFRLTGFVNAACTVAERNGNAFALKPQSSLTFDGFQAPVRTIAHWEAAHRNVLADEPQLRSIIDNELLYGLRLIEDAQILTGNGVGENLLGILNTPGVQSYNWSDGAHLDSKGDAIRRAATLAYLAYYPPTGVVLHPNDWEDVELTKNTNGTYLFAVSMQVGGDARLWSMPIVDTPAMPEGKALVGAFGTGAQLYDREEANIRISESHADFFVRNAIVILAEERLALAVKRPESFVVTNFNSAPA